MVECICPGDVPVCPSCGRRWDYVASYSDGSTTYTSKLVRDRFAALYGEKSAAFMSPVETAGAKAFAQAVNLLLVGSKTPKRRLSP